MSEKLSERAARIGGFWMVEFAPEIAALEQQLAAKDAEIARLRDGFRAIEALADKMEERCGDHCSSSCKTCGYRNDLRLILVRCAALAETSAAPHVECGLPPQRSMTPEESANLAKFKRVAAQDDGLREEVPIIHGRAELAVHDAALRASVREETLDAVIPAIIKWLSENPKWPIMSRLNSSLRKAAEASSLASEKAAPEDSK